MVVVACEQGNLNKVEKKLYILKWRMKRVVKLLKT